METNNTQTIQDIDGAVKPYTYVILENGDFELEIINSMPNLPAAIAPSQTDWERYTDFN